MTNSLVPVLLIAAVGFMFGMVVFGGVEATDEGLYVLKSGDQMTGDLFMNNSGTDYFHDGVDFDGSGRIEAFGDGGLGHLGGLRISGDDNVEITADRIVLNPTDNFQIPETGIDSINDDFFFSLYEDLGEKNVLLNMEANLTSEKMFFNFIMQEFVFGSFDHIFRFFGVDEVDFGQARLTNLSNGTDPQDAVTKAQLDALPTGGGGNPFDQSLNTTDNVEFNNLTVSETAVFEDEVRGSVVGYAFTAGNVNITGCCSTFMTFNNQILMSATKGLTLPQDGSVKSVTVNYDVVNYAGSLQILGLVHNFGNGALNNAVSHSAGTGKTHINTYSRNQQTQTTFEQGDTMRFNWAHSATGCPCTIGVENVIIYVEVYFDE